MEEGSERNRESRSAEREGKGGWVKNTLVAVGLAFTALVWRSEPAPDIEAEIEGGRKFSRLVFHGWLIVCGMALAFTLYGFFAFFVIGDKGPPDWDYGSVADVPGQSTYSTYPYRGRTEQPEPQHVNEKPGTEVRGRTSEVGREK